VVEFFQKKLKLVQIRCHFHSLGHLRRLWSKHSIAKRDEVLMRPKGQLLYVIGIH
jgi:hypothetical protein